MNSLQEFKRRLKWVCVVINNKNSQNSVNVVLVHRCPQFYQSGILLSKIEFLKHKSEKPKNQINKRWQTSLESLQGIHVEYSYHNIWYYYKGSLAFWTSLKIRPGHGQSIKNWPLGSNYVYSYKY